VGYVSKVKSFVVIAIVAWYNNNTSPIFCQDPHLILYRRWVQRYVR